MPPRSTKSLAKDASSGSLRSPTGSRPSTSSRPPSTPSSRNLNSRTLRGKKQKARQSASTQETTSNIEESKGVATENIDVPPEDRSGDVLWKRARGMKAGISIIAGKKKVHELIDVLKDKLSDVKGMLKELDDQKGSSETPISVPQRLPDFDIAGEAMWGDSNSSRDILMRKNETLYVGERFKFCYNPIDEHERYLPAVGVRAIKSYRGELCELLGDPADRAARAAWQRRLRIESAKEANGSNVGRVPSSNRDTHTPRMLRSDLRPPSDTASPRLRQPVSSRSVTRDSDKADVAFRGAGGSSGFEREVKRLHAMRALNNGGQGAL